MKFTILVITYNPIWDKVKITLESILRQNFKEYEIVISDDGSENNLFSEIEEYFKEKAFENYVLVPHKENQGIVKNLIDGLEKSSGKYVRDFGTGDFFYNENSLGRVYDFLEEKNVEGCFGLMKGYCVDESGQVSYKEFPHPFDIDAYREFDKDRILRNLILYRDNASGACLCCKTDYLLEYLYKLAGTVKYTEDIFQILAAIDDRAMILYPEYLVWYEMDAGVSTKKRSKFTELLELDVDRFYEYLWQNYSDNRYVIKQHKINGLYKIKNLYLRTMIRIFTDPYIIIYMVRHFAQMKKGAYCPDTKETGFLDETAFCSMLKGE